MWVYSDPRYYTGGIVVPVFSIISTLGETVVTLLLDKDNESNHHIRVYTIASPAIRLAIAYYMWIGVLCHHSSGHYNKHLLSGRAL